MVPRRHIPNLLTILRLVLAATFFVTLGAFHYPDQGVLAGNVAVGLFVLAAITDALDGALARRWNVISTFGRLMDPFCDKVLILGAFIYLAGPNFIDPERAADGAILSMASAVYPSMVVLILARELLVTGIRGVVESKGIKFGSNWSCKAKMILQSITVPIVIFVTVNLEPHDHPWAWWLNHILMLGTLVVTLWSGLPYITGARAVLRGD